MARGLRRAYQERQFPREAARWLSPFNEAVPSAAAYDALVRYFAQGWVTYRLPSGAGADYPGWPSWSGPAVDRLEAFARFMPLIAAWCGSGRASTLHLIEGEWEMREAFVRGLLAGTDPRHPNYWGPMPGRSNQRIVEAADVALALWLLRAEVWGALARDEQRRVVAWLAQVGEAPGLDKNWHLFFVLVDRVLAALGYEGAVPDARRRFDRVKSFHLGDGWFEDGPGGRVDYYNAWGFHYPLNWIHRIDPDWDAAFIEQAREEFLSTFPLLIGPRGVPILGRSVAYRMAIPAPLIQAQHASSSLVTPGLARRALDAVWTHFVQRGALKYGSVTQGYYRADARLTDPYSGPASPLWSLRSLVAAYALPPDHPFWTADPEPLPVERASYQKEIAGGRWRVHGNHATGTIQVEVLANPEGALPSLQPRSMLDAWRELASGQPVRPNNDAAKYNARWYGSDVPFCVSSSR